MAEQVKVLNTWVSMFGMRVLLALKLKGVAYEYQEEDLLNNKSQLLLKSNPIHKKIPVLLHNGKPVCESLIIVQYIDEVWQNPNCTLLPSDPYQRAQARFWADYIDKKVYDAGSRIIRCPEGPEREQAKKDMVEIFTTLDGALRDLSCGKPYFGGDKLGFVDVAMAPFICWFEAYETLGSFKLPNESQCPHLCAWQKKILEHPTIKETFEIAPSKKVVEFAEIIRKK